MPSSLQYYPVPCAASNEVMKMIFLEVWRKHLIEIICLDFSLLKYISVGFPSNQMQLKTSFLQGPTVYLTSQSSYSGNTILLARIAARLSGFRLTVSTIKDV